jgi:hypothetical protein
MATVQPSSIAANEAQTPAGPPPITRTSTVSSMSASPSIVPAFLVAIVDILLRIKTGRLEPNHQTPRFANAAIVLKVHRFSQE